MKLHLENKIRLSELPAAFSRCYPGLSLQFIFTGNEKLNLSNPLSKPFPFVPIAEITPKDCANFIELDDEMTIADAEKLLLDEWHLPAQIFITVNGGLQRNKKTESCRLGDIASFNRGGVSTFQYL